MRSGPVFLGHIFAHANPSRWTLMDQKQLIFNDWNADWTLEDVKEGRARGAVALDFGLTTGRLAEDEPLQAAAESCFGLERALAEAAISADEMDEL